MSKLAVFGVVALVVGCRVEAPEPTLTPSVGVDAEIAEPSFSALTLWRDATGGTFAPVAHIGCDGSEDLCIRAVSGRIAKCDGQKDRLACMRSHLGSLELGTATPVDQRVSTLAHELGHYVGLEHTLAGLMNPTRPESERRHACVDSVTLDAFAFAHPAERSFLAVRCAPTADVVASSPAVLVGGFVDPAAPVGGRKAEYPIAGQDLQVSDGSASYRVMFGKTPDGETLTARINAVTGATIAASLEEGRLVLTTVETGEFAEIHVVGGTALEGLGLAKGDSAFGQ